MIQEPGESREAFEERRTRICRFFERLEAARSKRLQSSHQPKPRAYSAYIRKYAKQQMAKRRRTEYQKRYSRRIEIRVRRMKETNLRRIEKVNAQVRAMSKSLAANSIGVGNNVWWMS